MIAAFFCDERFTRDESGTYYTTGTLPYRTFAKYLKHFDKLVVVGRLGHGTTSPLRTVASGDGVEWACIDGSEVSPAAYLSLVSRRVREVLERVDCAFIRLPNSVIALIACREAIRSKIPWLAEVAGDAFDALWNHGSLTGKVVAVPNHLLNRYYIGRAPYAAYVTQSFLQRRYPPGGEWVGVSDVMIETPRADVLERRLARIAARDGSSPATLGLVGSYDVAFKGHETALRAVESLQRSGRPVTLRCIGVGNPTRWRARAATLGVERRVELGGALPQGGAVLSWMDELDIYIMPSLQEGLPRALVEAMSRALPAIGSRRGGIPELLEPRWLHRPGDHRALASLVAALLDSRAEMAAQARRNWRAASEYTAEKLDAIRDELLQQFKAAVATGRARGAELSRAS